VLIVACFCCCSSFCSSLQILPGRTAVIVGGGPTGFAAALALAKRGWSDVTIIETRPSPDWFERDKAFCYQIDGRGQSYFSETLGLRNVDERFEEIGVPSTGMVLTRLYADRDAESITINFADPKRKTAYWIPRHVFIRYLSDEAEKNWSTQIRVLFNTRVTSISRLGDGSGYSISSEPADPEVGGEALPPGELRAHLLIGADGMNGLTRLSFQRWEEEDGGKASRFGIRRMRNGSTGLKYKVLPFPPNFPLDREGTLRAEGAQTYVAVGKDQKNRLKRLRLGMLPSKDESSPRPANIVTFPDHEVWTKKTGEEVLSMLESSFPQLPIRDLVTLESAEEFATSKGGEFPAPQHARHLCRVEKGGAGGVLLGDAAHAFPPDLGQGVNSALEDVKVFCEALDKANGDLATALPAYEARRLPDARALIRLVKIGYPWQYKQSKFRDVLWACNFALRMGFNKMAPRIFAPQVMRMVSDHRLAYSDITRRADRTTACIFVFLTVAGSALSLFARAARRSLLAI
jgi:kynurenine 3-monooxygenase